MWRETVYWFWRGIGGLMDFLDSREAPDGVFIGFLLTVLFGGLSTVQRAALPGFLAFLVFTILCLLVAKRNSCG